MRNPVDRLTHGMSHGWRVTIDWLVTIVGAIAIVLAIKAWIVNPYRIPSSSMEPTLHCARPGSGCEAGFSDRVLACRFCYHLWSPKRGDIIVFQTPALADVRCPHRYFMMGDNRSSSCDSREWGSVPRKNLIGKVFATYWPPDRIAIR